VRNLPKFEKWSDLVGENIGNLNIIVIGEAMLDCYLQGYSNGASLQNVPIVTLTDSEQTISGATDLAIKLKRLGAKEVTFLSVVGDDWQGELIWQALEEYGIITKYLLTHPSRQTLTRQTVMAGSESVVRFDSGSTDSIDSITEKIFIEQLEQCFPCCDIVIICDSGYGIVTEKVKQTLVYLKTGSPHVQVVNSDSP
jgi:bifunctional ADP-heptose synthase (sugar kinase/adenylyltransferase)